MKQLLPTLTLALLAAGAAARAAELRPYQARYNGIWHGMIVAVSDLKLERTGDTWTYSSSSTPRGIGRLASGIFPPRQISVVRITDSGVRPLSYRSIGGESAKSIDLTYDWRAARVTGTYQGVPVDLPLTPEVQDDASVELALTVELLAGRTPNSFRIIDGNGTRQYQFARDGEATLQTPMGAVATVVYRSQKAHSPRITRFWCAPDRGYVPLKVEQTKGDEVQWTMEIQSLTR
jgi:hypothetical protein